LYHYHSAVDLLKSNEIPFTVMSIGTGIGQYNSEYDQNKNASERSYFDV
jgi:hypothetical protein